LNQAYLTERKKKMPNHCSNRIAIVGDEARVKELQAKLVLLDENGEVGTYFNFNAIVPEPENNEDWYGWRCQHWGTKWNSYNCNEPELYYVHDDLVCSIDFDTAWSPPHEVIEALAPQYPDLCFLHLYWEGGIDFSGKREYVAGNCVDSTTGDGSLFAEEFGMEWYYEEEE
jgi:hypothetical protein